MRRRALTRLLFSCLALLLPLGLLGPAGCTSRGKGWNVVLLTLDTTRADALGCYGAPPGSTPNLDALAAQGTRFEQALSTAALTPVSHASILSGLNNKEHGLRVLSAESGYRLPEDVPTLATVLRDAGYTTVAVHSAFPVSAWFGFEHGFDVFESFDTTIEEKDGKRGWNVLEFQRRSDETTSLVLDWLTSGDTPFFLWVHYWDPHDGVKVPPPEYLGDVPKDKQGQPIEGRALYAAEVRYMDHEIGRLFDALRARGEFERTLFVVVADHGEGLGDHGWEHHRILYQEQIHVPLIVKVPGRAPTPPVAPLVRTIDIYPTVLDLLGVRAPRPASGRSLRALLEGASDAPRTAFADQVNGYDLNASMVEKRPLDDFLYAVVREGWKLVYRPAHPDESELFDLTHDPHEARNLWRSESARRIELLGELARQGGFVTRPFPQIAPQPGAQNARNVLQGLGYGHQGGAIPPPDSWRWVCPTHSDEIAASNSPCPLCGSPRLPILRKN